MSWVKRVQNEKIFVWEDENEMFQNVLHEEFEWPHLKEKQSLLRKLNRKLQKYKLLSLGKQKCRGAQINQNINTPVIIFVDFDAIV